MIVKYTIQYIILISKYRQGHFQYNFVNKKLRVITFMM